MKCTVCNRTTLPVHPTESESLLAEQLRRPMASITLITSDQGRAVALVNGVQMEAASAAVLLRNMAHLLSQ